MSCQDACATGRQEHTLRMVSVSATHRDVQLKGTAHREDLSLKYSEEKAAANRGQLGGAQSSARLFVVFMSAE